MVVVFVAYGGCLCSLWWLFHRCKELRYVDLTGNKRINGKVGANVLEIM